MRPNKLCSAAALALLVTAAAPREARAFCGFYVGGADTRLFNNATMVVMMREGTRTVLAMQNNYQGPPSDFAMVVPVPIVLQKENVKTLPREVFDHVDALAAPRLVEYWEQDPCPPPRSEDEKGVALESMPMAAMAAPAPAGKDLGVRIEAQFTVGEYEVVVLSAADSMGLDTWLRQNKYQIPAGAEPILRPYVQGGMKFFVAKVDVQKVKFEGGMAMLSPLRFHYDSETFGLPVRLGLLNSAGTQDLIVHILARGKRYEVANYPNVTIPTNYDVAESARAGFGAFYAALFDRTLQKHPGAVVTEYAWDASSCDPCPTPALEPESVATLGADVLDQPAAPPPPPPPPPRLTPVLSIGDVTSGNKVQDAGRRIEEIRQRLADCFAPIASGGPQQIELTVTLDRGGRITQGKTSANKGIPLQVKSCLISALNSVTFEAPKGGAATVNIPLSAAFQWITPPAPPAPPVAHRAPPPRMNPYGFVLTRLHARYGKDALGQDLVFREAPAIEGGRENYGAAQQDHGAKPTSVNNFQGRYAIRHPWAGPITCKDPRRNVWGGPPAGVEGDTSAKPALKVAFAPRGQAELGSFLREGVPELEIPTPAVLPPVSGVVPPAVEPGARGCGSCDVQGGGRALLPSTLVALGALLAHERRRRRR